MGHLLVDDLLLFLTDITELVHYSMERANNAFGGCCSNYLGGTTARMFSNNRQSPL